MKEEQDFTGQKWEEHCVNKHKEKEERIYSKNPSNTVCQRQNRPENVKEPQSGKFLHGKLSAKSFRKGVGDECWAEQWKQNRNETSHI